MTLNLKHVRFPKEESVTNIVMYYPILTEFLDNEEYSFSSEKINKYLGYEACAEKGVASAELLNFLLDRLEINNHLPTPFSVVYVDNTRPLDPPYTKTFTIGKSYEVIREDERFYWLRNDKGQFGFYLKDSFSRGI